LYASGNHKDNLLVMMKPQIHDLVSIIRKENMSTVVAEPGQNIEGANLGETMNK
jgi:hypothetical protein